MALKQKLALVVVLLVGLSRGFLMPPMLAPPPYQQHQPPQNPMMQNWMPPMMQPVQPQFFDGYSAPAPSKYGMVGEHPQAVPPMYHGQQSFMPFQPPAFMMARENPMDMFGAFQPINYDFNGLMDSGRKLKRTYKEKEQADKTTKNN